jgi:DNA-binding SARP family transcriptional activator/Flp pilus assembly protein TadD
MMLQLHTLGHLGLAKADGAVAPIETQRKALVLLAILAASGSRGMSRDKLMSLLWPESDSGHASGALRQLLHTLRKQLGAPDLVHGAIELRLNPDCIKSDIGQFRELIARGDIGEAVDLYNGPFLDGISLPGVLELERWIDEERAGAEREYAAALERLAEDAEQRGDIAESASLLRTLQALDPCDGRTALRLITILEKGGDKASALQHALAHEQAIKEQLGISPNSTIVAAVRRLKESMDDEDLNGNRPQTSAIATMPTRDAEAYELYLKGRYYWSQRTRSKLEQALGYFHRAVERDPEFALAYVAMADAYVNMSNFGHMSAGVALARASTAAERAVTLAPSMSEGHASRGFVLASTGRLEDAEKSLQRAIDINPVYPSAHHYYTLLLAMLGRIADSEQENKIALKLNPLSLGANAQRGILRLMRRDYSGARNDLLHALALSPGFPLALAYIGDLDASEARYDEALRSLERARKNGPRFPGVTPALAYTYSRMGNTADAADVMAELETQATDDRSSINLGMAKAMTGDLDGSFSILGRVRWDVPTMIALRASPLLEPLRRDNRYATLG